MTSSLLASLAHVSSKTSSLSRAVLPSQLLAISPGYLHLLPACLVFSFIYLFAGALLFLIGPGRRMKRLDASNVAACVMSHVHGWLVILIGGHLLYNSLIAPPALSSRRAPPPSFSLLRVHQRLVSPNTIEAEVLMIWTQSFFLVDFFLCLLPFFPDPLFIAHHLICSFVMLTSVHFHVGASVVVLSMWLGELTSPPHTIFLALRSLRAHSYRAARLFDLLSPPYTLFYILIRTVLGPWLVLWSIVATLQSGLLPPWLRGVWGIMLLAGVLGSQFWSLKLWRGYRKSRLKKKTL